MANTHTLLNNLIGYSITLTLNDSIVIEGIMADLKTDFIIMEDKDGIPMYIPIHVIKEIKRDSRAQANTSTELTKTTHHFFKDLLSGMRERWLYVTRSGIGRLEGVLSSVYYDFLVFVFGEDIIYQPVKEILSVQEYQGKDTEKRTEINMINDKEELTANKETNEADQTSEELEINLEEPAIAEDVISAQPQANRSEANEIKKEEEDVKDEEYLAPSNEGGNRFFRQIAYLNEKHVSADKSDYTNGQENKQQKKTLSNEETIRLVWAVINNPETVYYSEEAEKTGKCITSKISSY